MTIFGDGDTKVFGSERVAREAEERTRIQTSVDVDRRSGDDPISISRLGDIQMAWLSTGVVASGDSKIVYLTSSKEANGENIYTRSPIVQVMEDADATGGGIARAVGPAGANGKFNLRNNNDFKVDESWDSVNFVWSVKVTNNTGASTNFVIKAWGV
jgi:hypothetical protein